MKRAIVALKMPRRIHPTKAGVGAFSQVVSLLVA
jgi:hypothetical protein